VIIDESEISNWIPADVSKNPSVEQYENLLFEQLIRQRLQRGYQIVLLHRDLILSSIM
jgi:hypothetical protein